MVERRGRVEDKVAIVTGAGSTPGPGVGTGKASAVVLAREGAKVLCVDLAPDRAEETKALIEDEGGVAEVFGADCTKDDECAAMVQAAVDAFGTVDILVNNIGRAAVGTVVNVSEEDWDTVDGHQRPHRLPRVEARRAGDGREGRRLDRQHLLDLGGPRRRHGRLLGGQGRHARHDHRHGVLARSRRASGSTPSPPATSPRRWCTRCRRPVRRPSSWTPCAARPACSAPPATGGTWAGPRASSPATRPAGSPVSCCRSTPASSP